MSASKQYRRKLVLSHLERCGYRIVKTDEDRGVKPSNIGERRVEQRARALPFSWPSVCRDNHQVLLNAGALGQKP